MTPSHLWSIDECSRIITDFATIDSIRVSTNLTDHKQHFLQIEYLGRVLILLIYLVYLMTLPFKIPLYLSILIKQNHLLLLTHTKQTSRS